MLFALAADCHRFERWNRACIIAAWSAHRWLCALWWQVWEPHDEWRYKKGGTLDGHTDTVSCMCLIGPYMVSGSHDKSICCWGPLRVASSDI